MAGGVGAPLDRAIIAMTAHDNTPAPGNEGNGATVEQLTDGGEDTGPDWEGIARRRMASSLQMFYEGEVVPFVHGIPRAIEDGEDPVDDYWKMVSRFGEYAERVGDDLVAAGALDSDDPRVRLHATAYYLQERLLQLGKDIQADSVDSGLHGDSFVAARRAIEQAEAHVDELEEEYRGRFPDREEHEEQLEGITNRHPEEDDDE